MKRSTGDHVFCALRAFLARGVEFELPLLRLGALELTLLISGALELGALLPKGALELRARAPSSSFGVLHEESDCFMIWFFLRA